MRVVIPIILVLALVACADKAPPESKAAPRLGIWVLAEGRHRTLEDPDKVERLIAEAEELGVTDLFVQIYRAGRSWYPSELADDTPYAKVRRAHRPAGLRQLLDGAHARGLRVHAWFNALSLHRNREAPLLQAVGRDAVLVDREGRSLLDYPRFDVPQPDRLHTRLGTPGIWLDAASPGVKEYLEKTVEELVARLPDLDGLHLDFVRHPLTLPILPGSRFEGLDFGYGPGSIARFEEETGQRFKPGQRWDDFRREKITELVQGLKARLPPHWEHSAAVLPWADRAYLSAMQDWRRWLEDGQLDFAVAMLYTKDDRILRYVAQGLVGGIGGDRVWLGLGSWLFLAEPERVQRQIDLAAAPSPAGIALFSYDSLAHAPETLDSIRWPPE
jgi:uncharacterized lipoprotein YddW (UPF0748 family)